mgnify:CR=1 FL=1
MHKPAILLIYTGGTIGMVKDFETGALKAFNFNQLLERIPELQLLDCTIDTYSFEDPIDSSDMNPEHWITIAEVVEKNYHDFDGFVVLHGSDTMSYTASALSFMLKNLSKPVILTGSQLPIGDLRTDAKENLITAIQIASLHNNKIPVIKEVGLYFEYKLYRGNRTTKISAEHFNAFTSPNLPHLAESGVHLKINEHLLDDFYESNQLIMGQVTSDNEIKAGDLVETSGLGGVIPSGLYVGKVAKVTKDDYGLSKRIYIEPAADLGNITTVVVAVSEIGAQ